MEEGGGRASHRSSKLGDRAEILRCLQDVQGQLGEMREFVEIQLSVHRDLLDRVVTHGFAAEHSVAVSAKFAKGPEALKTIQEDLQDQDETETVGTTDTIETPLSEAKDVTILESQSPSNAPKPGSYAQLQLQNLQARHLRVTTKAVHAEFQKRNWRSCIKQIIFSPLFSLAITLLILLNVVLLGVEVDVSASLDLDEVPSWFATVNAIIVTVFVIEMILKIFVLGCRDFWCGEEAGWNCFDFAIVSASVLDLAVDIIASLLSSSLDTGHLRLMRSIRVARAIRGIRVVRIFRYITALRTLALSIISTMSSLFWTLALLILVFYLFSVVITQMVLDHCRHLVVDATTGQTMCPQLLQKFWGSVPESMLTLFMAITNGLSWDDAIRPLRDVSYVAVFLVVIYVTIAVFAILNVVTGAFCNTAIESAHADKEVATIKQVRSKDQQVEALRQIFYEIDNSNQKSVNFEDMIEAISTGELASFMEAMGISTDDIRTLCTLLDADKNGRIDLDEFVSGCMQLHGPAKSLQLAKMSFENKLQREELKHLTQEIEKLKMLLKLNYKSGGAYRREDF